MRGTSRCRRPPPPPERVVGHPTGGIADIRSCPPAWMHPATPPVPASSDGRGARPVVGAGTCKWTRQQAGSHSAYRTPWVLLVGGTLVLFWASPTTYARCPTQAQAWATAHASSVQQSTGTACAATPPIQHLHPVGVQLHPRAWRAVVQPAASPLAPGENNDSQLFKRCAGWSAVLPPGVRTCTHIHPPQVHPPILIHARGA